MDEKMDRVLLLAIAVGVAAGTAAAVTSFALPSAINSAYAAIQAKRKKEQREHRHRSKADKGKKSSGKRKEHQTYKDVLRQSLVNWKDINVSLDEFPYFLSENTKTALLDSMYIYLRRPEYVKYTANLASVSPRILLTGPPGSEIYQELLVKALAHQLEANLLVLDCANMLLDIKDLLSENAENISEPSQGSDDRNIDSENKASSSHKAGSDCCQPGQRLEQKGSEFSNSAGSSSKSIRKNGSECGSSSQVEALPEDLNSRTLAVGVPSNASISGTVVESSKRHFKRGDRVKYVGPNNANVSGSNHRGSSGSKGPTVGSKGRVLLVLEENLNKVGVRFDKPVYGGNNLVDLCEDGHGFFCNVSELRLENSHGEDSDMLIFESLVDLLSLEASKEPLILLIKDVEKSIMGNIEHYKRLEQLDKTGTRLVIVGSYTSEFQKEKGSGSSVSSKSGSNLSALLDLSFLDNILSRIEDFKGEGPKASRMLVKLFPTRIYLQQPQEENLSLDWNQKMEQDTERLKAQANRQQLRMVMGASNVICDDLSSVDIKTYVLTQDMSEKVVGWAISHELQLNQESVLRNGKLVISAESLQHSVRELMSVQRTSSNGKKTLKDVVCDNEFEKILLSEVIPPDELGVTFDHIGALDNVKEALRELVMLPLQRPELFTKGQLRKPCRGLLLFGPPGTGKTMLAKAVATEAGANFINISLATIASKWFGEAEKYVKAVFTLASKISPSVIFIDEVDSMLGRRGKDTEHSAMRKLKNEFMSSWDGLRTREKERVLVLAATNRPFDLDEAVIRRFPRRLMVDLPDALNRAKILKIILADEDIASDLDIDELASATDSYSGSDLKNLCTTAAYQRIREILDQEKKEKEKAIADGREPPPVGTPYIRPLNMADMKLAMEKVRSSVASDATSMLELQQWNDQYGEGGSRKTPMLSYFL